MITAVTDQNQLTPISTPVTATVTPQIESILGTIIFRTRLAKGWNGYDPVTQSMAVETWHEILATEKVPPNCFDELYRRACNHRAHVLYSGKEPPDMSAELMLAQWIGESGLRKELRKRQIAGGRTLGETTEAGCLRCHKGLEYKRDPANGRILGVKGRCDHRALVPGEYLYEKQKRENAEQ